MRTVDVIKLERIAIEVKVHSRKSVLEALSFKLSSADGSLAAQRIFETLLNRERLGTTDIAIPYERVDAKLAAIGTFLKTENPIDFSATDNRLVDLFFALCVPIESHETHLALLGELVARLREREFLNRSRSALEAEEIATCFSEITDVRDREVRK